MVTVIDYGMGNLASVQKAFEYIGVEVKVTSDPEDIRNAVALVLPGVGAISDAMSNLRSLNMQTPINDFISSGRPFLGICLGMQMLFETSAEGVTTGGECIRGLGILAGNVLKLPDLPGLKIPHMGWNSLCDVRDQLIPRNRSVYFVHSYYVNPTDDEIVTSRAFHGIYFTSSIKYKNITAMQFHPEKSGDAGIEILKKWILEIRGRK